VTWLVVGASSGLGRALAERLARDRRSLLLVSSDQRDLTAISADLQTVSGATVRTLAHDAADYVGFANRLSESLGPDEAIEGLLFPLGAVSEDDDGSLDPVSVERLFRVNFLSVVSVVSRLLPRLFEHRSGVIIGFGSVAAIRGRARNVAYAASKRALESYFESLRHLCEPHGLTVAFYVLGYVDTNLSFGKALRLPRASTAEVAERVCSELGRKRGKRYLPGWWVLVGSVVRHLPWSVFRRMRF
jgi:short-subunit dehydrogenase